MQPVSSQPFRRMPFNCMFRIAVQIFAVSCPFGAYISIRLWRRPITLRTDTARQRLHSTLIMPSAFLNPINWVPQFGQYQENGYQVSLHSSTSDPLFLNVAQIDHLLLFLQYPWGRTPEACPKDRNMLPPIS